MPDKLTGQFLSQVTEEMTRNRNVYGAALCVENGDKTISWAGASGNINENDRYFIASVTKLCVSMLLLRLRAGQIQVQAVSNKKNKLYKI